jgi:carbohydrate-selective porin OprB
MLSSVYDSDDADTESEPAPAAGGGQAQISPWSRLADAWDGLRKTLDNRGIQFGVRYDGEGFADVSGGLRRGGTYLSNLNLQLTLDAQRLIGWPAQRCFCTD